MGWTNPKTWSVGETLTAANFNTNIRDNVNYLNWQHKYKASDQTVTVTTLTNDSDLFFAVAANERWFVECSLLIDSNATADFNSSFTVPAGATMKWGALDTGSSTQWVYTTVTVPTALADAGGTKAVQSPAAGTIWGLILRGIVQVGGTAGNVQLQWAQNAGPSGSTIVKAGSLLIAHRVST
jgi:hypothetical protein